MTELIYQTGVIALMAIGGWMFMALGAYLITVWCLRLPFFFWRRPNSTLSSSTFGDNPRTAGESNKIAA